MANFKCTVTDYNDLRWNCDLKWYGMKAILDFGLDVRMLQPAVRVGLFGLYLTVGRLARSQTVDEKMEGGNWLEEVLKENPNWKRLEGK